MGDRLAAADVVGDVLDIGHRPGSGGHIHGCDVDADPMTRFELVRRGEDLYPVLDHFARLDRSDCVLRELVERLPGLRALLVKRTIRRLQPTSRQLAFGQLRWNIALTLA